MTTHHGRPTIILLADDDPGDQELTRRALEEADVPHELHIVQDGEEALDYLFRRGAYQVPAPAPRPDLMLLDLNMPRIDGREVLRQMRTDRLLRRLVVVILTTSHREEDVLCSYNLGANSYIIKPVALQQFVQVMHALGTYWTQTVVLPPQRG